MDSFEVEGERRSNHSTDTLQSKWRIFTKTKRNHKVYGFYKTLSTNSVHMEVIDLQLELKGYAVVGWRL